MFFTGVTPDSKKPAKSVKIFYEVQINGKSSRYPAQVTRDAPGHSFRYICTAKGLPTNTILTNVQLVLVEPGAKPAMCPPLNFDGRALILASARDSVVVDGKPRSASAAGRITEWKKRISCVTGMGSLSGLAFDWNRVK